MPVCVPDVAGGLRLFEAGLEDRVSNLPCDFSRENIGSDHQFRLQRRNAHVERPIYSRCCCGVGAQIYR